MDKSCSGASAASQPRPLVCSHPAYEGGCMPSVARRDRQRIKKSRETIAVLGSRRGMSREVVQTGKCWGGGGVVTVTHVRGAPRCSCSWRQSVAAPPPAPSSRPRPPETEGAQRVRGHQWRQQARPHPIHPIRPMPRHADDAEGEKTRRRKRRTTRRSNSG